MHPVHTPPASSSSTVYSSRSRFLGGLVAGFLASFSAASAATYYISTTGADGASRNGSSSQPWTHINYAITRMSTGDDLIIREGTYYWGGQQTISKGGTSANRMIIQGEAGKKVVLNGQYAGQTNGIVATQPYVTIKNIEVTNYPYGSGIRLEKSYSTIDGCKAYDIAYTGLQIGAEISSWSSAPTGSIIQGSSVWNCGRTNDPSFWDYKGLREFGGSWTGALSAVMCYNPVVKDCWAGNNWGEGIILTRVRGGNTAVTGNYARDNYAANIYLDSVSGESSNWISVANNTAETTYNGAHYRSGAPAWNFAIAAENYDGFLVGSNDAAYLVLENNQAYNGGHNFKLSALGKPVHDVLIRNNTASGSTWGNYSQETASYIYNIYVQTNTGF